jgi:hypothetical protein
MSRTMAIRFLTSPILRPHRNQQRLPTSRMTSRDEHLHNVTETCAGFRSMRDR